jgi:hypothetical protein
MHTYDDLYGGRFLSATDIDKPIVATIERIDFEAFEKPGQPTRTKAVVYVKGGKKGVVINKTNASALAAAFGKAITGWVGKRVTIKAEPTQFAGKPTVGLRLYPANGTGRITSGPIVPPEPPPRDDMDDEIPWA